MRTAKELFQASPVYRDFQAILTNPAFESACNAALLDLFESLPKDNADPSKSWDCHLKMVGAHAVLDRFSRLHEPDTAPVPSKPAVLKYQTNQPNYRP